MTQQRDQRIAELADGELSHEEIAIAVDMSRSGLKKAIQRLGLPSRRRGGYNGERNHQFETGRRIATNGYVLVSAPAGHPNQRIRKDRKTGTIPEHRLVLEGKLGRLLLRREVADHIDGLTIHNDPANLRVFASNADHLRATLSGPPKWSPEGRAVVREGGRPLAGRQRVDIHGQRRVRGEIRLRQILLAWLSLDKDSPYLSGTHKWLKKAQIDWHSRPSLERALDDLYREWGWPLAR